MNKDPLIIYLNMINNETKIHVIMHMKNNKSQLSLGHIEDTELLEGIDLKKCMWELYNERMVTKIECDGFMIFELTEISLLFCHIIQMAQEWSSNKNTSKAHKECKG